MKEETKKSNKEVAEAAKVVETAKKGVQKDAKKEPAKKEESKKVRKEESKKVSDKAVKKPAKKAKADKKQKAKELRYFEAVGRRKTATARIRLYTKGEEIRINDKDYKEYFPSTEAQNIIESALVKMKSFGKFSVSVKVKGGGKMGQAEAVRHGISRTLVLFNSDFRKRLKRAGYLKRDPRMKERKKFGLKRARKASQWSKR